MEGYLSKYRKLSALVIIFAIITIGSLYYWQIRPDTFDGTITAWSCTSSGIGSGGNCTIKIGSKFVIYKTYDTADNPPQGQIIGDYSKNSGIGEKVRVRAAKVDANTYTLDGSSSYYVKQLK